ncbi:hypothetical protein DPQ25_08510 [Hydrogeniiclostridium mannosilyticum]|uniref:Uncharacterized protein n=1 Tax=Hydrogeniiclostridium mannosilyticum TaxID=2764322 RepID=A0A328UBA1_9FIRM|nr:hypothetical protein DPQ25_08510 [Hydrogeniiclostridium mannosilyticum]
MSTANNFIAILFIPPFSAAGQSAPPAALILRSGRFSSVFILAQAPPFYSRKFLSARRPSKGLCRVCRINRQEPRGVSPRLLLKGSLAC